MLTRLLIASFLRLATNCMPSRVLVGSKIGFNMTSTIDLILIDGGVDVSFFTCLQGEGSKVGPKVEGLLVKFKVPPCILNLYLEFSVLTQSYVLVDHLMFKRYILPYDLTFYRIISLSRITF